MSTRADGSQALTARPILVTSRARLATHRAVNGLVDVPRSGAQKFSVRAVDGAGIVDPTPAAYAWTSDLTPPKRPKVCVKVDARDKVGNVSAKRTSCTTIPDSFAPPSGPYQLRRVRDAKGWRGHHIVMLKGQYLTQPINDSAFSRRRGPCSSPNAAPRAEPWSSHWRVERDGQGMIVLLQASGKPRLSGVGFTN